MSKVFALKWDFDPREVDRQFILAASDYGTTILGGPLTADIAERAPRARIRFTPLPPQPRGLLRGYPPRLRRRDRAPGGAAAR